MNISTSIQLLFHLCNSWVSIFKWWKKLWYFTPSGSFFFSSLWSSPRPPEASNSQSVLWGSWILYLDLPPPPTPNRSEHTNSTKTEQGKHGRSEGKCVGMFSGPIEVVVLLFPPAVNCPKPSMLDMLFPLFSFSTTSHETAAPPYQSDITTSKSGRLCTSIKCLCFSTCDLERQNSWKQCPCRKH